MGIMGFGEMLPYHENKISLNKTVKDKWGLPVLDMDVEIKENEKKMREDMMSDAKEMLEAAGLKNAYTYDYGYEVGMGIHEMGTARMGRDAKSSVLNANNQVWDCKNVFVTDGACMTSASCVNPSLTYMAMTARAANFAVEELKKQFNQVSAFATEVVEFSAMIQEKVFGAIEEISRYTKDIINGVRGYIVTELQRRIKEIAPFLFPSEVPKLTEQVEKGLSLINCLFNKLIEGLKGLLANLISNILSLFLVIKM
jgi:hypothetical protein